jgi:hypothetical protein
VASIRKEISIDAPPEKDDEVVQLTDQSMETGVGVVKKALEAAD